MIAPARPVREELTELAQRVRAECRATQSVAAEAITLNEHEILARGGWKMGRGRSPRAEVRFYLDDRRLGLNALIGKLRKEGIE